MRLSNKAIADVFPQDGMISGNCKSDILQCAVEDLYIDKDFCRMYGYCGYKVAMEHEDAN